MTKNNHAAPVSAVYFCEYCGAPAECYGSYEGAAPGFACGSCCGHGCEDGRCELFSDHGGNGWKARDHFFSSVCQEES